MKGSVVASPAVPCRLSLGGSEVTATHFITWPHRERQTSIDNRTPSSEKNCTESATARTNPIFNLISNLSCILCNKGQIKTITSITLLIDASPSIARKNRVQQMVFFYLTFWSVCHVITFLFVYFCFLLTQRQPSRKLG